MFFVFVNSCNYIVNSSTINLKPAKHKSWFIFQMLFIFRFFLFSQKTWKCPTGKQNISQSNCKKIKYTITEIIGQDRKSRQVTCFKTKIPEEDTLEHASSYSFSVSTLIDSSIASSRAPSIVSRFSIVVSVSVIPSPFVSPIFTITYNIYNIWTCTSHWVGYFSQSAFLFQFS